MDKCSRALYKQVLKFKRKIGQLYYNLERHYIYPRSHTTVVDGIKIKTVQSYFDSKNFVNKMPKLFSDYACIEKLSEESVEKNLINRKDHLINMNNLWEEAWNEVKKNDIKEEIYETILIKYKHKKYVELLNGTISCNIL